MMGRMDSRRVDDLLASVTDDLLNTLPQALEEHSLRAERLLLELVRPDPADADAGAARVGAGCGMSAGSSLQ
jgi:hypothetical protein